MKRKNMKEAGEDLYHEKRTKGHSDRELQKMVMLENQMRAATQSDRYERIAFILCSF